MADPEERPRVALHALNDVVVGRNTMPASSTSDATIDGVALPTSPGPTRSSCPPPRGAPGTRCRRAGRSCTRRRGSWWSSPVAPHTGLRDPLVVPSESLIELRVRDGRHTMLSADGFQDTTLGASDRVVIERSPYTTRFLRADGSQRVLLRPDVAARSRSPAQRATSSPIARGHLLPEHVDQPVGGTMQAEFLSIAAAIFYQSM